jgi:hypothetical protein
MGHEQVISDQKGQQGFILKTKTQPVGHIPRDLFTDKTMISILALSNIVQ